MPSLTKEEGSLPLFSASIFAFEEEYVCMSLCVFVVQTAVEHMIIQDDSSRPLLIILYAGHEERERKCVCVHIPTVASN